MASSATPGGKPTGPNPKPVSITKDEIRFMLTEDEIKQAADCLLHRGNIKITFKEINVTHLPVALDNGRLID